MQQTLSCAQFVIAVLAYQNELQESGWELSSREATMLFKLTACKSGSKYSFAFVDWRSVCRNDRFDWFARLCQRAFTLRLQNGCSFSSGWVRQLCRHHLRLRHVRVCFADASHWSACSWAGHRNVVRAMFRWQRHGKLGHLATVSDRAQYA